jgi:hypothetical protein
MKIENSNAQITSKSMPIGNMVLGGVSTPHKAYQIDLNRLDEGYLSDTIMCYANNVNEAKKKLLQEVMYDNWRLKYTDEELTYLNIPVIRRKSDDKILFEGKPVTEIEMNRILYKRERNLLLENILNDVNIKYCYIKKGSYYRPNSCGYTDFKHRAGVYTKEDAVKSGKSCEELTIIPIDILEHNKMIEKEISELSSRLL